MIYYKEEKKKLVIPSGFVMIPIECDEAIEQAREQGYQEGFADGSSATCDTEEGTYSLTDDFDGEETVFPSEGKTGFNKIVIVDDGYGDAKYDEGYEAGIADCSGSTPCDCSSAITEAYQSGYTEGYNQGQADCPECSGGTCSLQQKVFVVTDPAMENVFPDAGYDGLSQVMLLTSTLWDSAHTSGYNEGYQSGYTAGQADCPECSGGTGCNLENGRVELGRDWDGNDTIYPSQGYDGFGSIQITDNGYGDEKYQSGYTEGYNDGQGGGCNLQEKSVNQNTNLVTYNPDAGYDGLRSISVDATGVYSNGHTDGQNYARSLMVSSAFTENGIYTRAEGWNSVTVNVQQSDCSSAITEAYQSGYTEGYTQGQADCPECSGSSCNLQAKSQSIDGDGTGIWNIYPDEGYDGLERVTILDDGYGQAKFDQGYSEGRSSGYTEGYNAAITANCGSAITEAYESGVTEGQGSIFSVKVMWLSPVTSWNLDNYYYPDLFIIDESGTSHQLNYVYQQSPTLVRYNTGVEDDTPQGWIMFAEFAGYLQDGAKYIQPYQVKFPMLNNNLWNNNIEGLSVEINGEVIHNWRQDNSGLDGWQFGSGAWKFTPLATVVSDTYYDATHKMVTFYIQGQVPNNN